LSTTPGGSAPFQLLIGRGSGTGAVALLNVEQGMVVDIFDMPTLALSRGGKNKRGDA
jgi:hypothetical protein